jgi:hypothetical protein
MSATFRRFFQPLPFFSSTFAVLLSTRILGVAADFALVSPCHACVASLKRQ